MLSLSDIILTTKEINDISIASILSLKSNEKFFFATATNVAKPFRFVKIGTEF